MNNKELLKLFKSNVLSFLDNVISVFPKETHFIFFKLAVKSGLVSEKKILKDFSEIIIPHKEMVLQRNEEFFLTKCKSLVSNLPNVKDDDVDHFKNMWTSEQLTDEDRENIWKYFILFLNIALKYEENNSTK